MLDAVVISDLHLGARVCQTEKIEDFLYVFNGYVASKRLILNGDVLESSEHRLNKDHWRVLSLLRKLSDQLELIWVAGNHDYDAEPIAHIIGAKYVEAYAFLSGGEELVCVHGDRFDTVISKYPKMTKIADKLYRFCQGASPAIARWLKRTSKSYVRNRSLVHNGAVNYAKEIGYDKVICGHTHHATSDGKYFNSGCWTEETCHFLEVEGGNITLKEYE